MVTTPRNGLAYTVPFGRTWTYMSGRKVKKPTTRSSMTRAAGVGALNLSTKTNNLSSETILWMASEKRSSFLTPGLPSPPRLKSPITPKPTSIGMFGPSSTSTSTCAEPGPNTGTIGKPPWHSSTTMETPFALTHVKVAELRQARTGTWSGPRPP